MLIYFINQFSTKKISTYFFLIVIILLSSQKNLTAQISNGELAAYNIGLGGIGAGIGAVINKKPNEKTGNVFLKGLWRGGLGGALIFGSKKIINEIEINERLEYSWPAKFVNAAGVSIIEDAAANRPFGSQWNLHIGFNRIEFHTKDKFRVRYKVLPASLGLTVAAAYNTTPEWGMMLKSGEIFFSTKSKDGVPNRGGVALGNIIILSKDLDLKYIVIAHEIIHTYQYNDYNFTSTYFNKSLKQWSDNSKTYNKINKWVYWDTQAPILRGLYLIEEINANTKFDNFFEYEAQYFANKSRL